MSTKGFSVAVSGALQGFPFSLWCQLGPEEKLPLHARRWPPDKTFKALGTQPVGLRLSLPGGSADPQAQEMPESFASWPRWLRAFKVFHGHRAPHVKAPAP